MQVEGPVETLRISGLVKFGSVARSAARRSPGFDLPTAQRLFDKEGKLDQIRVAAKPGVSPAAARLRDREDPSARHARCAPATRRRAEDAEGTDEFISFLQYFLLAFGVIALFVGAFVIVNSLSITIAQRTRELATLRTLGASRRQVRRSVVVEALVMGLVASLIGLFLGLALAKGLFWLFDAVGFTLPNSGLLFETRTIVVSLGLGIVVTLIASIFPALRATRVPPIAAVREGATLPPGRFARFRTPVAALITAVGFALLIWGSCSARHVDGAPAPDRRHAPGLHRRRHAVRARHPRPLGDPRLAGRAARRSRRRARARQRTTEPAAHRVDRARR